MSIIYPYVEQLIVIFITVRNEVAKVMFLHLSVSHSVHRGGLPQCMLGYHTPRNRHPRGTRHPPGTRHPLGTRHPPRTRHHPPGPGTPWDQVPSQGPGTPLGPGAPLPGPDTAPSRRLLLRTVRILLECILVN